VFIINGIHILANGVIIDPTCANLVSQVVSSWGVVVTIITQENFVSYCNQHPKDDFILL
jgi:hypothetical protein